MSRRHPANAEESTVLAVGVDAPGRARAFVREALDGWGLSSEVPELLVSEVVTNAVLHAGTDAALWLRWRPPVLRVEVADGARSVPRQRDPSRDGGFGLRLVDDLSSSWGFARRSTGKVVWFEVDVTAP